MYILIFLLLIILFLSFLLIRPLIKRKFSQPKKLTHLTTLKDKTELIKSAGLKMFTSDKVMMSFNDDHSFYADLARLKTKLRGSEKFKNYAYYNFPRAFLALGLLKFAQKNEDSQLKEIIFQQTEKLMDSNGSLKFKFDKIDQVLFGVLFIELYKETQLKKYKKAIENIYKEVQAFKNEQNLFLYRKESEVLFIDTLGMLPLFLYAYADLKDDKSIKQLANNQFDFYLEKTIKSDLDSFPPHAYDLKNKMKLGSTNWARGMGWFMIGLSEAAKTNPDKKVYIQIFENYWSKLEQLKIDQAWPQFLGHTNDYSIDASATLMLYFAKCSLDNKFDSNINQAIKDSISSKGFVLDNSGDTIYINKYSRVKGKSELSQGLLINLLTLLS